jgi:5'-nucleotidase / UDP-sugar diphosphatase
VIRRRPPRVALWLVCAVTLLACATPSSTRSTAPPTVHLTLLQVNDVYMLEPVDGGRRGGLARLAALVREIRAENPNTFFALAGDVISPSPMSTVLRGEQMIAAFNAAGLDAATFGNHEFDFGPDVLMRRIGESRFAWVAANVLDRRTGLPFGGARDSMLVTLGGIPVGVFGVSTVESRASSSPGPDIEFRDPLEAARAAGPALRRRGARLVVALTHQHMAADRAMAADAGGDVDVILGGHEHEPLVVEEGKTLITKAGSEARYLVRIDLWLDGDGRLVERSWRFREVSARIAPDPTVAGLVADYEARLGRELDVVIGHTAVALEARRPRLRTEETNVGDFIADVMRRRMETDVAVINGGGIRTDRVVPPGVLSRRDVNALLPFTNVVMKLETSGARLREALEQGLAHVDREAGGFLQVSGLRLVWDPHRPAGARIDRLEIGGAPLDPARRYTVALVDYLARGGDGVTAFRDARVLVDAPSGPSLAELVLEAITTQGTIAPSVEGRIQARNE